MKAFWFLSTAILVAMMAASAHAQSSPMEQPKAPAAVPKVKIDDRIADLTCYWQNTTNLLPGHDIAVELPSKDIGLVLATDPEGRWSLYAVSPTGRTCFVASGADYVVTLKRLFQGAPG